MTGRQKTVKEDTTNEPPGPDPAETLPVPIKATSSWVDAFTNGLNPFLIAMLLLFLGRGSLRLLQAELNLRTLCFILLNMRSLGLYLWASLARS
jgi:hypothetical protein